MLILVYGRMNVESLPATTYNEPSVGTTHLSIDVEFTFALMILNRLKLSLYFGLWHCIFNISGQASCSAVRLSHILPWIFVIWQGYQSTIPAL